MEMTRITSFYEGRLVAEHIYARDQVKALEWFRRDYPEHNKCIVVAEDYDENDPKNAEHFRVCSDCGCVHYW